MKTIKEYSFPEIQSNIIVLKGKITKEGEIYYWDLSHFCKLSPNAANPYFPSRACSSFGEAERSMKGYVSSFTEFEVTCNNRF